jgi:hypothetical protein
MAASVATTTGSTSKTLRPSDIEIPGTSSTNHDDAPELLSPRSWRGRGVTYQPPSRRHTARSLDAEDYFVRFFHAADTGSLTDLQRLVLVTCPNILNGLSSCACTAPYFPR